MRYGLERRVLLATNVAVFALLAIHPRADRFTWFMENFPVILAWPILLYTRDRFGLSRLLYRLLWIHALILMVGGFWTYAEVPLGFWVRDALGLARNHYDRLGHFAQGFVPAILIREYLLRRSPLVRGKTLAILVVASCLAISALYEFLEWWTAVFTGTGATAFLGTQGDPWDTQWDMFLATVGATTAQLFLSGAHDRSMTEVHE